MHGDSATTRDTNNAPRTFATPRLRSTIATPLLSHDNVRWRSTLHRVSRRRSATHGVMLVYACRQRKRYTVTLQPYGRTGRHSRMSPSGSACDKLPVTSLPFSCPFRRPSRHAAMLRLRRRVSPSSHCRRPSSDWPIPWSCPRQTPVSDSPRTMTRSPLEEARHLP